MEGCTRYSVYCNNEEWTYNKGVPGESAEIRYSAVIEYRNRTPNSVEVRIVWTTTLGKKYIDPYSQHFKFSVDGESSGTVNVASFGKWGSAVNYDRSETATSPWVKVSLDSKGAETIDLKVYYWQANKKGDNISNGVYADSLSATWTIEIPAY